MVSAMIDECIFENMNENCNSKFDFDFTFYKSIKDLHKRINKSYNEIERGEKNESL